MKLGWIIYCLVLVLLDCRLLYWKELELPRKVAAGKLELSRLSALCAALLWTSKLACLVILCTSCEKLLYRWFVVVFWEGYDPCVPLARPINIAATCHLKRKVWIAALLFVIKLQLFKPGECLCFWSNSLVHLTLFCSLSLTI